MKPFPVGGAIFDLGGVLVDTCTAPKSTLWGSIIGSGLVRLPGWDHR
jgi:hypothetical protein